MFSMIHIFSLWKEILCNRVIQKVLMHGKHLIAYPPDIQYFSSIKYLCHIINHVYLISMFVSNSESRTIVSSN
jgi:hypothetical protein